MQRTRLVLLSIAVDLGMPEINSKSVKVGARLAHLRSRGGTLTRAELAQTCGTQVQHLPRLYREAAPIGHAMLLAEALGVTPVWLMDKDRDVSEEVALDEHAGQFAFIGREAVHDAMRRKNLTVDEVARDAQCHRDCISHMDVATASDTVLRIAKLLGLGLDDLFALAGEVQ